MGQTLSQKILSRAAGRAVQPGDLVIVEPHVSMEEELGVQRVHDPNKIVLTMDHVAPAATVGTANNQNIVRRFAQEQGVRLFEVGRGICHQVLVEEKVARPGEIVLGSDSHSTSYGSVGAFGSGMGSTDIALIWATGRTWLRVPETIQVQVSGSFPPGVYPKDLALKLEREMTIDGASYATVEYHGLEWLPLEGRQTLASMAVELGAKAGIVPPSGEVAERFDVPEWYTIDPDAPYARTVSVDLDELEPQVALPHAVDNVVNLSEVAGTAVDVVFLGTCTNGRYEDMRQAADVLSGRHVAGGVRLIVTPASQRELQRAVEDGTLATLLAAGAVLTTPGCGACMGRHQGTLGDDDVCLSTGNRNFKGRMGSPSSRIYLASPAVAAATAVAGRIADPREILEN